MEFVILLILHFVSGAIGGNLASALLTKHGLGVIWNTIAGIIGGGIGGQFLVRLLEIAAGSGALDIDSVLAGVAGGIGGGGVLVLMLGDCLRRIRKFTGKSD